MHMQLAINGVVYTETILGDVDMLGAYLLDVGLTDLQSVRRPNCPRGVMWQHVPKVSPDFGGSLNDGMVSPF